VWFQVERRKKKEMRNNIKISYYYGKMRRNSNRISFEIHFGRGHLKEKRKENRWFPSLNFLKIRPINRDEKPYVESIWLFLSWENLMRFKWLEKKADFRSSIDNTQNENEPHKNRPKIDLADIFPIPRKRKIIKDKPDKMDFQTKRLEKPKTNRALDKRSAFKTVPRNKLKKKEKELLHNPCC
jgi:hypothetical protein